MTHKYPFKNLVFKGGGIKAFAYIGALEAFEQHNVLSQIERVAGNSAGSSFQVSIGDRAVVVDKGQAIGVTNGGRRISGRYRWAPHRGGGGQGGKRERIE